MPTLLCHPDVYEAIKGQVATVEVGARTVFSGDIRVITNKWMEKDRLTGKFCVNGQVVAKQDICVRTPFIEYGPEDIEWLLYAGLASEDREPVIYVMDDHLGRGGDSLSSEWGLK